MMQAFTRHIANIDTIDGDAAIYNVIEAHDKVYQGRFTSTCRTYDSHHGATRNVDVDILHKNIGRRIAKINMLKIDCAWMWCCIT